MTEIQPISLITSPSLGDLIGYAIRIVRTNFAFIFRLSITPTLINSLAAIGLQFVASTRQLVSAADLHLLIPYALLAIVCFIVAVIAKLILSLRLMAFIRTILGYSANYQAAYEKVKDRKWQVLGAYFFLAMIFFTVLFALIALAVFLIVSFTYTRHNNWLYVFQFVSLIGLFLAFVIVCAQTILACYLVLCILACESRGFADSINQALTLINKHFLRSLLFVLLTGVCLALISYPLGLPATALSVWDYLEHGILEQKYYSYTPPLYIAIINQVWESMVSILIWPLFFVCFALFYNDLRIRSEAIDLKRKLDVLFGR